MRSFFSRSPDLEGGQSRGIYKKGFTGDHRGRSHIPPNPSPLFSPQSQHSPFSIPSASYRHDTIFRPPPSPSPKSVTFSERSWSALSGPGNGNVFANTNGASAAHLGNSRGGEKIYLDRDRDRDRDLNLGHLDQEQLSRLHEYLGVLPARGTGVGVGREIPRSGRRGFSMSDPNDRDRSLHISPTSVPTAIPPPPLSPHSRLKKNLKQKVAEHQFRRNRDGSAGCSCEYDVLLGDEEKEVHYRTRIFREALRNALGVQREMGLEGVGSGGEEKDGEGEGEGKKPVMQRRGASEGVREGGFTGPMRMERKEEVAPRDLGEFLEKYDPRPEDLPDVYPMGEHRAMLRTMYLEDILHATAKLHMHNWILLSRNEKYEDLRIPARWDQIQEDLEKYTRSIRNYTYWLSSPIPLLDLPKSSLPPRFHLYGKQLAILECARAWNHPREVGLVNELERKLVAYQTDWSVSNGVWRGVRREARRRGWRGGKGRGLGRFVGGVVGGSSILTPISILILWPGGISKTGGVGIIGVSVAIMGIILVWMIHGGGEQKSGWEGIEGERDGDGRGGIWGGEWGLKDVMLVLGAYAGVLGMFLGVAVV
ncbi:uncharacterized protein EAE98_010564 [Botrytis deweyae]|uniref:Uncharacterized protein n=1 Tax=Botrytis deweyae TaxID=2478750 RepID=A0ABQ7I8Q2_9HELO|nr:uncharacterized protein EAE98_010564 [Botrytis deweyae]KAF7916555.1 hypothetical protein EAE98_010564 [Botrytis deweyae]